MKKTSLLLSLSCAACGGMVETGGRPSVAAQQQDVQSGARNRVRNERVHRGGANQDRPQQPRQPLQKPGVGHTQGNTQLEQTLLDAAAQVLGVDDLGGPQFQLVNLAFPAPEDAVADLNLPDGLVTGLSAYAPGSQRYFSQSGAALQITHVPTGATTQLTTEPLHVMEYDAVDDAIYGLSVAGNLRLVRVNLATGDSTVVADLGHLRDVVQSASALDTQGRELFFSRAGATWAVGLEDGTVRHIANVALVNFGFNAATGELVGTLDQAGHPFARLHAQSGALVTGADMPGAFQGAATLSPDGSLYFSARPVSEDGVSVGAVTVVDVAAGQVLGTVTTRAVSTLEHMGASVPL